MRVETLIEQCFFASLAVVAYVYLAYPVLIWWLAGMFGTTPNVEALGDENAPRVTLLIAAHNEKVWIERRIENALAMDYPRNLLEIVVASDGSTDGTCDIVRKQAQAGVRLLDYPERRGKATVLNTSLPEVEGEIVILSDANTFLNDQAVRQLVRWFRDPTVGVVCGRLDLVDRSTCKNVDGMYWRYETFLKQCEASLGALLGANGAIYAIRRSNYTPIPSNTLVDDLVIPLLARLRTGCRTLFDPEAVATEETPTTIRDEFRRRVRIGAGGFQSIGILWRIMHPRNGWVALCFLSHKVLRWLAPFFLIGAIVANALLLDHPMYRWTMAAQGLFYAVATIGPWLPGQNVVSRLLRVPAMFSGMNLALLAGFFRWLAGRQRATWHRTAR